MGDAQRDEPDLPQHEHRAQEDREARPQLLVADWNAFSAGKPWFGSDGLHLSATGATQLASFLRPYVFRAASLRA